MEGGIRKGREGKCRQDLQRSCNGTRKEMLLNPALLSVCLISFYECDIFIEVEALEKRFFAD